MAAHRKYSKTATASFTLDAEVLDQARDLAQQMGLSLSAKVNEFLAGWAAESEKLPTGIRYLERTSQQAQDGSSGATQSRPFPARAAKRVASAGPSAKRGTSPKDDRSSGPDVTAGETAPQETHVEYEHP